MEIDNIVDKLDKKELKAGDCITVKTGYVHSVEAIQDLTIMEASTLELDDVYRLNDKRANFKLNINKITGSNIIEVKSY